MNIDIDFEGDEGYMRRYRSGSNLNPDYIENYGAHVVWVDYEDEGENTNSHLHKSTFKGYWRFVNNGVKITKRQGSRQSLNGLEIYAKIWGAKKFADIQSLSFSKPPSTWGLIFCNSFWATFVWRGIIPK